MSGKRVLSIETCYTLINVYGRSIVETKLTTRIRNHSRVSMREIKASSELESPIATTCMVPAIHCHSCH
jgi:hypothetical protein